MRARRVRSFLVALVALVALTLAVGAFTERGGAADSGRTTAAPAGLAQVVRGQPSATPQGYTPSFIRDYYHFSTLGKDAKGNPITGTGQTIAIVLYGDYPEAPADLQAFIDEFKLQPMLGLDGKACTPSGYDAEPCFEIVNAGGKVPPTADEAAEREYALDIEWAHAAAPGANIVMVQGQAATPIDLTTAIQAAVSAKATVVSMSFSSANMNKGTASIWDGSSVAFVASEGDNGYPDATYPAADANVLAVGGTSITASGEEAWVDTGGGPTRVPRPDYQVNWSSSDFREVNDVAYNAWGDLYAVALQTGPTPPPEWITVGGVSAGVPQWAGIIADADQLRVSEGKSILARDGVMAGLYLAASDGGKLPHGDIDQAYFKDITTGCADAYTAPPGEPTGPCVKDATKGYDELTGLGSPNVASLVEYLGNDV